ncbi:formylmethanofuran--tetrahydromethanopterin N-formyltransferase [Candidatus Thorarchaeota archaeon]|nr:MAG: formylmethanofuran--tetrahydromethanopterin N-formyltransferase [Candidatus Thorarchaeota archaeon]
MKLNGVEIEDTFAEAFSMHMNRTLITAYDLDWARVTALEATGFATSVIGAPAEAGIEYILGRSDTPDNRPGVRVIFGTMTKDSLGEQILVRLGQCVLTSPTANAFDETPNPRELYQIGDRLSRFGDGYQTKKGPIGGRILWLIPRMSGNFIVQESFGRTKGVAGGNIICFFRNTAGGMEGGRAAVRAIEGIEGAYTPFPGGLVGSGSKPSSKYSSLPASTNERYCPTLAAQVEATQVPRGCNFVLEIVINGISEQAVTKAMAAAVQEVCKGDEALRISAGNFEGSLGKYKLYLHDLDL